MQRLSAISCPLHGEVVEACDFLGVIGLAQILDPSLLEFDIVRVGDLERNRVSGDPFLDSVDGFFRSPSNSRWEGIRLPGASETMSEKTKSGRVAGQYFRVCERFRS